MRSRPLYFCALVVLGAFLASITYAQGDEEVPAVQVSIERPGEGETFYAGPASLLYSITISGWASANEYDPPDVAVGLDIIQDGETVGHLDTRPRADGSFFFSVTANPEGLPLNTPDPTCLHCHYASKLSMPPGTVQLRVTARDPRGQTAISERRIIMDRSGYATIPVSIEAENEDIAVLSNLPVTASGWLYSWRARYGTGTTNAAAQAQIKVEALAEAPSTYFLTIAPTVRDGRVFESIEPVVVVIPPGAIEGSPITLYVRSRSGQLAGLVRPAPAAPLGLLAIRIPDGTRFSTETSGDGAFHFPALPAARFLLAGDPLSLGERGLMFDPAEVDLTHSAAITTSLHLKSAQPRQMNILVTSEDGDPVPFAWVTVEEIGRVRRTSPFSGEARLYDLPDEPLSLTITAPGFYSRAHLAAATTDEVKLQLAENSAAERLVWGRGELIIPPEAAYVVEGERISLIRGWLWGSGRHDHAASLAVGPATLQEVDGSFAVETVPGKGSWLYVLDGSMTVQRNDEAPIHVNAGQMMALLADGQLTAVPLDMWTVELLQTAAESPPPPPVWQPTLAAQVRDRLARLGVTAAQLITFITYIIILLSLVVAPLVGVYLWRKQQGRVPPGAPNKEATSQ